MLITLAVRIKPEHYLLKVAADAFLLFFVVANVLDKNAWQMTAVGTIDIGKQLVANHHHFARGELHHLHRFNVACRMRLTGFLNVERVYVGGEALNALSVVVGEQQGGEPHRVEFGKKGINLLGGVGAMWHESVVDVNYQPLVALVTKSFVVDRKDIFNIFVWIKTLEHEEVAVY